MSASSIPDRELGGERRGLPRGAIVSAIALLFLALRVALFRARPPFYDEMFTRWIVSRAPGGFLRALRFDSGPPLYYAIVRLVSNPGTAITAGRIVSLIASAVTLTVFLMSDRSTGQGRHASDAHPERSIGRRGLIAAALFGAFPAAVFASCDARSYALCAMFLALALAALDRWYARDSLEHSASLTRLGSVVAFLVLAAYSHDYGVLFFPAPFLVGLFTRDRRRILEGFIASAVAGLFFIPGFLLAAAQPREAIAWIPGTPPAAPFAGLAFASRYPAALLAPPATPIILLGAVLLALAIVRTGSSPRAVRFAAVTLLPIVAVVVYGAVRHPVYFPLRFESVVVVPLVLWLAAAMEGWARPVRWLLTAGMIGIGVTVVVEGSVDYQRRGPDPYRATAVWARHSIDPHVTVVSSGYAYLEVWNARGPSWHPRLVAFPRQQGEHPGWRAIETPDELAAQRNVLFRTPDDLIWIGERGPEMRSLLEVAQLQILHAQGPVVIARIRK